MTVSYTGEVSTCKGFGCFLKLLFRWRGSIYKLVWPDLFLFLGTFFSLSTLYRVVLDEEQKRVFEKISNYCRNYGNLIPISFILGFYVSIVVGRWWDQYKSIPWTDSIAVFVSASIQGQDEKGRVIRRTIMRYCCLSMTMCFTMISPRVKKRFPSLDHFVEAGLLLENEKEIIDEVNRKCAAYHKIWIPIIWASSIVTRARKEGKIRDDFAVKTIIDELNKFRGQCGLLISYDWISVPLVYTQVVTLAVYSYFAAAIMGSQWLVKPLKGDNDEEIDLIIPVFTLLQFFFYMGWLKVAESLVNPFGDDDDDFELNWLVDRNLQVSYLIVDEMHHDHPELMKDQWWGDDLPPELPYTVASEQYRHDPPVSSTAKIKVSQDDGEIVSPPSVVRIDDMSECGDVGRRVSLTPSKRSSFTRRERTASVRSTASQSTLAESVSGKLSRAASITSVFKRMFSRDRDRENLNSPLATDGRLPEFIGSTTNMHRKVFEDVIPELDENMTTIISMKKEYKPTVQEIFARRSISADNDVKPSSYSNVQPGPSNAPSPESQNVSPQESGVYGNTGLKRPVSLNLNILGPNGSGMKTLESIEDQQTPVATPQQLFGKGKSDDSLSTASISPSSSVDADESMDDLQVKKRKGGKLSERIAKTFGFSKVKESADDDERTEEHLLSDVSTKDEEENKTFPK
ncbi:unnamed protein product [Allacma fusca]|uniref:Bestrophin homolog n=1 Tax=Allacma fusca TaxID=39272 RepID=A0A8J2J5W8_9HEXA|nr:unnamed protein product [Allacma fusca]